MTDTLPSDHGAASGAESSSGMSVTRVAGLAAAALIGFALLLFVAALLLAIADVGRAGAIIEIFRDIFFIVLAVEGIVIIGAIALLVIQIARLVNLLRSESKPILENAQQTLTTTKVTAEFIGKNATGPIIQVNSFFAGLWTFLREMLKINRLIKPSGQNGRTDDAGKDTKAPQ